MTERFELTDKHGKLTTVDKELRNTRHRENYIALMKRKGYTVRSLDQEYDHEARNVRAYVDAQERAMFERYGH
jgi:hypothetical protein